MKEQLQGVCPNCEGENLEYGGSEQDGEYLIYDWYCPDCQAEGCEYYICKFVEHQITKKGKK